MEVFTEFLNAIEHPEQQSRTREVLQFISDEFPQLEKRIGWNQPIFTDHGTYIAGFSISKKHLGLGLESATMEKLSERINTSGYKHTKMVIQLPWNKPVDYAFIREIIAFNIADKKDVDSFWHG